MIAFSSGLPLLQVGNQAVAEYTPNWLEDAIRQAAKDAGHDKWWFASDVTRSVFIYLRDRFHSSVITIQELFEKIRRTLEVLGFQDIAQRLSDAPPPWRISLPQLASEAAVGYELRFFQLLQERLDEAVDCGATQIKLVGVKSAAKALCGASKWRRDCERLRQEVAALAKRRLHLARPVDLVIS